MWNTYIAIGDSITEGFGDPVPGYDNHGWVPLVVEKLRKLNPEMKANNFGQPGSTIEMVKQYQVNKALAQNPDLITLTIGANDANEAAWTSTSFANQYAALLQSLISPGRTLITMTYPSSGDVFQAKFRNSVQVNGWSRYFERLNDINQTIRETSKRYNLVCFEFQDFEPFKDPQNLSYDMVHPNSKGYWLAAQHILRLFQTQYALPESVLIVPEKDLP
jgi:lysophospholipase L1-like esterase